MEGKVLYEVQGNPSSQPCVDAKEVVEKLDQLHAAVDAALEKLVDNDSIK